jgi:hypothetical protein
MRTAIFGALIFLQVCAGLATIGAVGKPREPVSPLIAVVTTITTGLICAGIAYLWRTA